jgi:cell division protein FtsB
VARVRATLAPDNRQGPRFTGRAVVLLLVALLLLGSYTSALRAWWTQRAEIQTTQAEIAMRHDAIEDLEDTKRRFDDPAFIQQQARERFGWVMPGEVGYRVIGSDGEIQGDVAVLSEPAVQRERQWYDTLWASVEGAGSTESGAPPAADPDKVIRFRE